MRIKLRCPHCGDWFTLNLGIENAEAESRESDEQVEEADADDEPARPRPRAFRGRLIGAICVVAAAVIIVWAVTALRSERAGPTGAPSEVSARPAVAQIEAGRDQGGSGELDATESALSSDDVSSAESGASDFDDGADEVVPADDEVIDGEDAPTDGDDGTAVEEGETVGDAIEVVGAEDEPAGGSDESGAGEDDAPPVDADAIDAEPVVVAAIPVGAEDVEAASSEAEPEENVAPAALDREILELEIVASSRCWIRVKADGVVVADATLNEGERRSWRADGFFDLDVGAGDAVRLRLNGEDLGAAGSDARVVEGLRVTREGFLSR